MIAEKEIFDVMSRFDSEALALLLGALPDPVLARLLSIIPPHIHGRLFGAIEKNRMDKSIRPLLKDAEEPDPDKDMIVRKALTKFANDLIAAGRIRREGDFYSGA